MDRLARFSTLFFATCLLMFSIQAQAETKKKVYKMRTGLALVIYQNPTIHSAPITKLPANSRWILRLSGKKKYSSSTWLKVSWNGKKGWVDESKIIFDSQATSIAIKKPNCLLSKTRSKDCNSSS